LPDWIDRHERAANCFVCGLYGLIVAVQANVKLLWTDELFTIYIAQQRGWGGIWRALRAGADPNPPLSHALVQLSMWLFGESAWAVRLPFLLCGLVSLLCVWRLLRRVVSPTFTVVGVLVLMATRGLDYSYDGRSYAPLLACSLLALTLWVAAGSAAAGRRTRLLVGMAMALAAALSSNYYGALAFFPIAAGEAVEAWRVRPFRPGVWIGLALGALPLLAFLPLIHHNIAEFAPHAWNRAGQGWFLLQSYAELSDGAVWPVLALGAWALWRRRGELLDDRPLGAAVIVLLLYPLLGFAVAVAGAGMISPRCVLPLCAGIAIAAGALCSRLLGGSRRAAALLLVLMTVWVVVREAVFTGFLVEQRRAFTALLAQVEATSEPRVLVADSAFALPLYHYGSPVLKRRIVLPIDFDAIHRYEKDDSGEQNLWAGRREAVWPFPVVLFQTSIPAGDMPLLIVGRPDGWLAHLLAAGGYRLQEQGDERPWQGLGGVFTPMGHSESRILHAQPRKEAGKMAP
jgi:hypothetical protein